MSYPPQQQPPQGGYPPQGGGYPPQGGGYPPQGGGYPPQGGYPYPPPTQKNTTIAVLAAIYMIILFLLSTCGGILSLVAGGFSANIGSAFDSIQRELDSTGNSNNVNVASAVSEINNVTTIATIYGVIGIVLGIALITAAVGIFMKAQWAYMATIIVNGAYLALQVFGLLTGAASILNIVFGILCLLIVILFYTSRDVKSTFGRA